jgi:hypothetical protein
MAGRIKQYPSRRQDKKLHKKGLEKTGVSYATKRQSDYAFGVKDPNKDKRKMHDPMKELNKAIRGGGGGGGFGGGRWTKDKMGRRHLKIM